MAKAGETSTPLARASLGYLLCCEMAQMGHTNGLLHAKQCLVPWLWVMTECETAELLRVLHLIHISFVL